MILLPYHNTFKLYTVSKLLHTSSSGYYYYYYYYYYHFCTHHTFLLCITYHVLLISIVFSCMKIDFGN
jgi:hypothetical protein